MDFTMSDNWSCFSSVHIFLSRRLKAFSLNNDIILLEKPLELVVLLQRVSKYQSVQMFWLKLRELWSSRTSQQPEASFSEQRSTWHTEGNIALHGADFYTLWNPSFLFSFTFCISHERIYLEACEELLHLWLEISSFWFWKDFGVLITSPATSDVWENAAALIRNVLWTPKDASLHQHEGRGDNDWVLINVGTISLTLVLFL